MYFPSVVTHTANNKERIPKFNLKENLYGLTAGCVRVSSVKSEKGKKIRTKEEKTDETTNTQ